MKKIKEELRVTIFEILVLAGVIGTILGYKIPSAIAFLVGFVGVIYCLISSRSKKKG
ncbi:hypothetical protein [Peptostreptococcus faecalis]|uniref:hypothetical protein n=1 Tax=Peptostreptococcus faecalis TaxID=2045015 RepID=UPI0015E0C7B1|nr:hypothetical protein [Peptostreptococcus faecalis]